MQTGDVVVGRFVLERLVAEEGGGAVWRARDKLGNADVALKLIALDNPEALQRFKNEATVLESLRHPAIVRYTAHGLIDGGKPYLVTEWLEGETLARRLARGPMSVHESLAIARRIAEALAVVHARRVVHRDVKPGNVLLRDFDVEKATLIDFGIARVGMQSLVTQRGSILGTPAYMSPEQAYGADVDARSDLFSLGCVLYRCLTGRAAFGTGDALAVLSKIVLQEAPHVREIADVPRALDDLVARLLSKDCDGRPADGMALAAELEGMTTGAPAISPPTPSKTDVLTHAEQGIVSIVIVGTRRTAADDVTVVRPPLDQELGSIVAAHGGTLHRLVDGSRLVVLAGRGNAFDQAALAARLALATHALAPRIPIALATGRGVLGDRVPVGEAIDRGVALLTPVEEGVHVCASSAALLDARFEVVQEKDRARLVGERAEDEPVRTLLGKPTPCVGRDHELASLEHFVSECIAEPHAVAVVVTGPSGSGKSRLRQELLPRVRDRFDVWIGRSDPVGAGSPFAMIRRAIRRAIGILDGESEKASQRKLRERIAKHVPETDRANVAELLGEIIGTPFSNDEASERVRAARLDPSLMRDQCHAAWTTWITAECNAHPLLLVLEELQWGDAPSVELVDIALRALHDRPFMVLALARPDVEHLFPSLWAERRIEHIRLAPLSKRAAEQLVRAALPEIDEGTLVSIVEKAAGNPLYLEELIRAISEGHRDELPETVLAMVQTRLEKLEPEARHLLRAASVFGQTFWEGGVRALTSDEALGSWLELLVHRELLGARKATRYAGEREYLFRHSVVREAAHAMLTDSDRALGHALAGAWLEAKGERDAALLADHFEAAGDKARAITQNIQAAKQALDANDVGAALVRAERGEACGATGADLGRLKAAAAMARGWRGDSVEAAALGASAMDLLERGSIEWCVVAGNAAREAGRCGDLAEVERIGDAVTGLEDDDPTRGARAIALSSATIRLYMAGRNPRADALAKRVEDWCARLDHIEPLLAGQVEVLGVFRAEARGDLAEQVVRTAKSARAFEKAGAMRNACAALSDLGNVHMALGNWDEAEKALRDVLEKCDRLGLTAIGPGARGNLALTLMYKGRISEALSLAIEAVQGFQSGKNPRTEGGVRTYLAMIRARAGDLDGALREARVASDMLDVAPPVKAIALATIARLELQHGRIEPALAAAREASSLCAPGSLDGDATIHLAHVEALLAAKMTSEAARVIGAARDVLLARTQKLHDPAMRATFLRIPDHVRTLELAERLLESSSAMPE